MRPPKTGSARHGGGSGGGSAHAASTRIEPLGLPVVPKKVGENAGPVRGPLHRKAPLCGLRSNEHRARKRGRPRRTDRFISTRLITEVTAITSVTERAKGTT